MPKLNFLMLILSMVFLVGCTSTYNKPALQEDRIMVYTVEEPSAKTYIVEEENSLAWFKETKEKRHKLNLMRAAREDKESQEEFEIKSSLSNLRRVVDNKLIVGYNKEIDNPRIREAGS
ncbi:hypothetical protein HYX01_01975 [Candidatus Woesearchaeota archaeon]|nr:hypothetical protein [Candidatus Woesearchaeota archaeon]